MNETDASQSSGFAALDRDQLLAALDLAEVVLYAKDLRGRYTLVNRMALAVTGLPAEQVIGKTDRELVPEDLARIFEAIDGRVLNGETDRVRVENAVAMADGSERLFENISHALNDSSGKRVGLVGVAFDITRRNELERELLRQRHLLELILNHLDSCVYLRDDAGRFHYVNRAFARLVGRSDADITGNIDSDVMTDVNVAQFRRSDREVLESGQMWSGEETLVDAQGRPRHFWTVKLPFKSTGQASATLIGISTEITTVHESREYYRELSLTDPLTRLRNRREFDDQLERELSRARRRSTPTALLLLDLDRFKSINDRFGHLVGDEVLVQVAEIVGSVVRREDVAARVGGEEFAVLMPSTDFADAHRAAERLRALVEDWQFAADGSYSVTVSVGIAICRTGDTSARELYARADEALYAAKRAGRNRVLPIQEPSSGG
ncbi:MAG: diguanylate cyclase [Wenzhouxiangellaceae bacterium]|nr:diguanylate cyclase [Wenzhouxiangellaceae bacterium]